LLILSGKGEPTLNAVDRQLKRIAQVFGKEGPPEVKEKTLKIFLKHRKWGTGSY
jgi:hypothetical protein